MRAMCGEQLKGRKRVKHLMLMLCLNETINQMTIANSVHWYGHVLRNDDSHVLEGLQCMRLKVKGKKRRSKRA